MCGVVLRHGQYGSIKQSWIEMYVETPLLMKFGGEVKGYDGQSVFEGSFVDAEDKRRCKRRRRRRGRIEVSSNDL